MHSSQQRIERWQVDRAVREQAQRPVVAHVVCLLACKLHCIPTEVRQEVVAILLVHDGRRAGTELVQMSQRWLRVRVGADVRGEEERLLRAALREHCL